jgi:hypothetical protein
MSYYVYAIKYVRSGGKHYTVGVSSDTEYGAVKRLCSNRVCRILAVAKTELKPEYKQRRIEGYIKYNFVEDDHSWEYK